MEMITALNVANTFLHKGFEEDIDISPMKLQKLIFILYKEYLKETRTPIFNERFETWKYGPVLRSVYDTFSGYKSNAIRNYYEDKDGEIYIVNFKDSKFFQKIFNKVWETYKEYSGTYLSMLTHGENTAWSKAEKRKEIFLRDEDIMDEESYE